MSRDIPYLVVNVTDGEPGEPDSSWLAPREVAFFWVVVLLGVCPWVLGLVVIVNSLITP